MERTMLNVKVKDRVRNTSFSFNSIWHRSARKMPIRALPHSQQSPQGCPPNSANICLVEHNVFDLGGRNVIQTVPIFVCLNTERF